MKQFDESYHPVNNELLFFLGFPGTIVSRWDPVNENGTLYCLGNELEVPGSPFLTQAVAESLDIVPSRYSQEFHELIHYPGDAKGVPNGEIIEGHNPRDLSGSLLWDTKRMACYVNGVES